MNSILKRTRTRPGFFDAGATISFGVDDKKSVGAIRTNRLEDLLFLLNTQGIEYTVIEGFKTQGFPKIVIGDLKIENCIAANPTVDEVLESLHQFEDYPKEDRIKNGREV